MTLTISFYPFCHLSFLISSPLPPSLSSPSPPPSFPPPVQFPEHPYGDLLEKVMLFKHCSDDTLLPLQEEDTIEDGMIVEIILQGGHSCLSVWLSSISI